MSAFLIGFSVFLMLPSAALWVLTLTPAAAKDEASVGIRAGSQMTFFCGASLLIATLIGRAFA